MPLEVAEIVATHAREVLLVDMRKRARHFLELNFEPDDSIDVAKMEQYFAKLDAMASKT